MAKKEEKLDKDKDKDYVTGLFGEKYKKYNKMTKKEKKNDAIRNIILLIAFGIFCLLVLKGAI
jgi:hypothetical protein